MANAWARDRARRFYRLFGWFGLAVVIAGFSTTYILPMARLRFDAPPVVHLHGAFALGWVLLLIVQAQMAGSGRTPLHRRLGLVALPLALAVLASGVATGLWAVDRDASRFGMDAFGGLTGTVTSLTLFAALVVAAIRLRRRPDWHKRLILLASIVLLWPAWFRLRHLLPFVPRPELTLALLLADLPILVAAVRDRIRYGAVHPAWKYVGTAVFAEQCLELWLFGSPGWNATGRAIHGALT